MYGAIKGRFNLDFGFPLCFDLDWFAERESAGCSQAPGSAVMAATQLYSVHYTLPHHYKGAKKRVGVRHTGVQGRGME